jgi:pimeloyl-ACP methyl ester carboxylesterase
MVLLAAAAVSPVLGGDEGASSAGPMPAQAKASAGAWTLGGVQFWSDELVYFGWRIQRNAVSGHYRLLDDKDRRHASGSFEECRAKLEAIRRERRLAPMKGPAVVTLHGLFRSRDVMEGLGKYLQEEGDLTWINVSYASTRRTLDEHAQSLARVLENLEGVTEIHLVCHSLGNLVVRRYVGEALSPNPQWKPDERIRRMVMLAPPNNGARMAEYFKSNKIFSMVLGPSGKQIAAQWSDVEQRLAIPPFEFGIIAGSKKVGNYDNPLLDGEDDLVVKVEETRLKGACDFLTVPLAHGEIMDDPEVQKCVLRFLKEGCFLSADKRMPIGSDDIGGPSQAGP